MSIRGVVVGVLLLLAPWQSQAQGQGPLEYGLMFDAGSSGTRIYIYQWAARTTNSFPSVVGAPNQVGQAAWSLKTEPGISAFARNLTGLCPYLQPLVNYARDRVPVALQGETELYLKATAGMRLLPQQDVLNVLTAVRDCFADPQRSPFRFQRDWAKVISGEEEGVYGWVTANTLMQTLGSGTSDAQTYAALDLGGASTQITFIPDETPLSSYFELSLAGRRYPVYTHSYLNYGVDRFGVRYLDGLAASGEQGSNPCYFSGYAGNETLSDGSSVEFKGVGDYAACKASVSELLELSTYCPAAPCALVGVHQPAIPDGQAVMLFSAFYYTAQFFGCGGLQQISCIDSAAQSVCGLTWTAAQQRYNTTGPKYLKKYCLNAAFVYSLLVEGYHLSPSRRVNFTATVGSQEVGWALGGMTYEVGAWDVPCTLPTPPPLAPPKMLYGVMLDAGSSGTRVYIYQWLKRVDNVFPDITASPGMVNQTAWSLKIEPGISTFPTNLPGLCPYLKPLIQYATDKIPQASHAETRIWLKATAGMRLLPAADVANILDTIRACFGDKSYSPFIFDPAWAKVISGEEEGVFGWVTANFLRSSLGANQSHWGALDLGGASTQITFTPKETPYEGYYELKLVRQRYPLYTHSYLNYGMDRAYQRVVESIDRDNRSASSPCFFTGYSGSETVSKGTINVTGAMDYGLCKQYTRNLLQLSVYCAAPPCAVVGVHQPDVPADLDLFLFSSFFYTADFFGCSGRNKIRCVDDSAASLCSKTWDQALADYGAKTPAKYLKKYCLQAAFVHTLLTNGYRMDPERAVTFAAIVNGQEIGWALGGITYEVGAWDVRSDNCYGTLPPPPTPPAPKGGAGEGMSPGTLALLGAGLAAIVIAIVAIIVYGNFRRQQSVKMNGHGGAGGKPAPEPALLEEIA